MRLERPNVEFRFYDSSGTSTHEDHSEHFALELDNKVASHQRIIDELVVEKPPSFFDAEQKARAFLASMDLHSSAEVYYLREDDLLDEVGMRDPPWNAGITHWFTNAVLMRASKFSDDSESYSKETLSAILVHELTHRAVPLPDTISIRIAQVVREGRGWLVPYWHYRSGLGTMSGDLLRGAFYEEGVASFVEGLYRRTLENPSAPLLSIANTPALEIPQHYFRMNNSGVANTETMAGIEAYTMELLAYGVEQRGIMSSEAFLRNLLATRSSDSALVALRTHAQAINALQIGLYQYLRDIPYSKSEWQRALETVYSLVVGNK